MNSNEYVGSKTETIDRILSIVGSEHFAPFEAGCEFKLDTSILNANLPGPKIPPFDTFTVGELLKHMTNLLSIVRADNSAINRIRFKMNAPNDIKRKYNLEDDPELGREMCMGVTIFAAPHRENEGAYNLNISTNYVWVEKYEDPDLLERENEKYNDWVEDTLSIVDKCIN